MKLRITVQGNVYDVEVAILEEVGSGTAPASAPAPAPVAAAPAPVAAPAAPAPAPAPAPASTGGATFGAPLAGTVRAILVKAGDAVAMDQDLFTLEAMKMETAVSSDRAATVKAVLVKVGDAVQSGQALLEYE